jgi:hypothetical protein
MKERLPGYRKECGRRPGPARLARQIIPNSISGGLITYSLSLFLLMM